MPYDSLKDDIKNSLTSGIRPQDMTIKTLFHVSFGYVSGIRKVGSYGNDKLLLPCITIRSGDGESIK